MAATIYRYRGHNVEAIRRYFEVTGPSVNGQFTRYRDVQNAIDEAVGHADSVVPDETHEEGATNAG